MKIDEKVDGSVSLREEGEGDVGFVSIEYMRRFLRRQPITCRFRCGETRHRVVELLEQAFLCTFDFPIDRAW